MEEPICHLQLSGVGFATLLYLNKRILNKLLFLNTIHIFVGLQIDIP